MKKHRAMKKIEGLLNLAVIFVIVLLYFSKVATACPHPPCNPCYDWNDETEQCEWRCSSGEACCGEVLGNCYNTTTTQCCDGLTIYNKETEKCG